MLAKFKFTFIFALFIAFFLPTSVFGASYLIDYTTPYGGSADEDSDVATISLNCSLIGNISEITFNAYDKSGSVIAVSVGGVHVATTTAGTGSYKTYTVSFSPVPCGDIVLTPQTDSYTTTFRIVNTLLSSESYVNTFSVGSNNLTYMPYLRVYAESPSPLVIYESPSGIIPLTVDFSGDGASDSSQFYVHAYVVPQGTVFDTVQIKVPPSQTDTIRMGFYGYTHSTTTTISDCLATDEACTPLVEPSNAFTTTADVELKSSGVYEYNFGTDRTITGNIFYMYFGGFSSGQVSDVYTAYQSGAYSQTGQNTFTNSYPAVIKLCLNGCDDDTFDVPLEIDPESLLKTEVVSLVPNATTTATSTSFIFGGSVYIKPEEYNASSTFKITVRNRTYAQQINGYTALTTALEGAVHEFEYTFPVTGSGLTEYSTTTDVSDFALGTYFITGDLVVPEVNEFDWLSPADYWNSLLRTLEIANGSPISNGQYTLSGQFVMGTTTAYDNTVDQAIMWRDDLLEFTADLCNPLSESYSLLQCVKFFILPTQADLGLLAKDFLNNTLRVAPLGYITRFIEIVTLQDATMPPALTYTYGTSAPGELQGKTVTFQIFEAFGLIDIIVADDGSNKNIWDIVMPYFEVIVGLGVLGVILFDVLALGIPDFSANSSPEPDYRVSGVVRKKEALAPQRPVSIPIKNDVGERTLKRGRWYGGRTIDMR